MWNPTPLVDARDLVALAARSDVVCRIEALSRDEAREQRGCPAVRLAIGPHEFTVTDEEAEIMGALLKDAAHHARIRFKERQPPTYLPTDKERSKA